MKVGPLIISALLIGGATVIWLSERRVQSSLREQNRELISRLQELARQNETLSNRVVLAKGSAAGAEDQFAELLRLRAEAGRLRQDHDRLNQFREENQRLRSALAKPENSLASAPAALNPLASWPKESWTFSGYTTPESALQSALWAASKGDLQNLIASMTGDFRTNITRDLETKPESEVAAEIMRETAKFNSVHLLEREVVTDQEVRLTLMMQGEHPETNKLSLLRVGSEWKLGKHD